MKKVLLAISLIVAAVTSVSAINLGPRNLAPTRSVMLTAADMKADNNSVKRHKAPSRAEAKSMDFALCGEIYGAWSLNGVGVGTEVSEAFLMNASNTTIYAGNNITAINVATGINGTTRKNQIKDITVFIKDDLEGAPVYSQAGTLGSDPYTWNSIKLDTPFPIVAGKEYFIGYTYKVVSAKDFYVVGDYLYHDGDEGGYVTIPQNGQPVWNNISSEVGFLCIGCTVEGTSLPTDRVSVDNYYLPSYAAPGVAFEGLLLVTNRASNEVSKVTVETKVGSQAAVVTEYALEAPIKFGESAVVTVSGIKCDQIGGSIPVSMAVVKVGDVANKQEDAVVSGTISCFKREDGFKRACVIEEGTGTWCGFCPAGIVALESMKAEHPDGSFIAIGVHNRDEMAISGYQAMLTSYFTGFPSYVANRQTDLVGGFSGDAETDLEEISSAYYSVVDVPAIADIDFECSPVNELNRVTIDSKVRFAIDIDNAAYGLVFVSVEDGVGPYDQENYYSGENVNLNGWETYPETVSWTFNDVARSISRWNGILNSVPTTVKKAENYGYSYKLDVARVKSDSFRVVGMIVDTTSGVVVNAVEKKVTKASGGVQDITVGEAIDNNAPVEYFNLQGVRVNPDNAAAGIYICRQGAKTSKVLVK